MVRFVKANAFFMLIIITRWVIVTLKVIWSDYMEVNYELVVVGNGLELLTIGGRATGYSIQYNRTSECFKVAGGHKARHVHRRAQAAKLVVKMFEKAVRAK